LVRSGRGRAARAVVGPRHPGRLKPATTHGRTRLRARVNGAEGQRNTRRPCAAFGIGGAGTWSSCGGGGWAPPPPQAKACDYAGAHAAKGARHRGRSRGHERRPCVGLGIGAFGTWSSGKGGGWAPPPPQAKACDYTKAHMTKGARQRARKPGERKTPTKPQSHVHTPAGPLPRLSSAPKVHALPNLQLAACGGRDHPQG